MDVVKTLGFLYTLQKDHSDHSVRTQKEGLKLLVQYHAANSHVSPFTAVFVQKIMAIRMVMAMMVMIMIFIQDASIDSPSL